MQMRFQFHPIRRRLQLRLNLLRRLLHLTQLRIHLESIRRLNTQIRKQQRQRRRLPDKLMSRVPDGRHEEYQRKPHQRNGQDHPQPAHLHIRLHRPGRAGDCCGADLAARVRGQGRCDGLVHGGYLGEVALVAVDGARGLGGPVRAVAHEQ